MDICDLSTQNFEVPWAKLINHMRMLHVDMLMGSGPVRQAFSLWNITSLTCHVDPPEMPPLRHWHRLTAPEFLRCLQTQIQEAVLSPLVPRRCCWAQRINTRPTLASPTYYWQLVYLWNGFFFHFIECTCCWNMAIMLCVHLHGNGEMCESKLGCHCLSYFSWRVLRRIGRVQVFNATRKYPARCCGDL